MAGFLFIAFITVPIAEIAVFLEVGDIIGFWPTIGIVVLTAFAGTVLLRQQGLATLRKAQASLEQNRFPIDEVFDGVCLLVAGVLLLTPGFVTDAVGLLLFVPPARAVLRRLMARFIATRGTVEIHAAGRPPDWGGGTTIDGEFQDITPKNEGPRHLDQGDRGPKDRV